MVSARQNELPHQRSIEVSSAPLYLPFLVVARPPVLEPVGAIGGAARALAVAGDRIYVGMGGRLVVFEGAASAALRQVGASPVLPAAILSVAVRDNLAFVALGNEGLRILDVTDPTTPVVVGRYSPPGWFRDVVVDGECVYLADGWYGLNIVDVSDPAKPRSLATVPQFGYRIAYGAGRVFIASAHGGLHLVDVSEPSQPRIVAGREEYETLFDDVAVGERFAYALVEVMYSHRARIEVLDLQHPPVSANPLIALRTVNVESGSAVAIHGQQLFVTALDRLTILDISEPSAPTVERVLTEVTGTDDIAFSNDRVFLSSGYRRELTAVDLRTPGSPTVTHPDIGAVLCADVAVARAWAYCVDKGALQAGSVRAFDVSTPDRPREGPVVDDGRNLKLAVAQDRLVSLRWADLRLFDISRPEEPRLVATYPTEQMTLAELGAVAISNTLVYNAFDYGRVELIDVAELGNPRRVGVLEADPLRAVLDIALRGRVAYLGLSFDTELENSGSVAWVDVGSPTRPRLIGRAAVPEGAAAVTVSGDLIYVAAGRNLLIFDADRPSSPRPLSSVVLPHTATDVIVAGRAAFVALYDSCVAVVDVSRPDRPVVESIWPVPGTPSRFARDGGRLYLAAADGGLLVFDVEPWLAAPTAGVAR